MLELLIIASKNKDSRCFLEDTIPLLVDLKDKSYQKIVLTLLESMLFDCDMD